MNKIKLFTSSPAMGKSKMLPFPSNSLTKPRTVRAKVKPIPIPMASTAEAVRLFFEAKASARPKMRQFTTIRGMKIPNCSYRTGMKASNTISTMVTKEAMIMINAGIRTFAGI